MATITEAECPIEKHDSIYTTSSSPTKESCSEDLESGQPKGENNIRSVNIDEYLLTAAAPGRSRWQWLFGRVKPSETAPKAPDSVVRRVDDCPLGYSRLATFLSSDRSFMQYRGFSSLHSRVLLSQQYDIEVLERDLDEIDLWDEEEGVGKKLKSKQCDDRQRSKEDMSEEFPFRRTRPEILAELKKQLMDYDTMLLKAKEVAGMQTPSVRDWRSVESWISNHGPLVEEEATFILKKEDLVTLRSGRDSAGFDGMVERVLSKTDDFLSERLGCQIIQYMFVTPDLRQKTSDKRLTYYSSKRVDKLVNVIIATVIFVLLILPVVAMYELSSVSQRASPFEAIGILIVFTLLFGMAMSGLTKATRQELFAASAAYCAVLVVFISNFSTQQVEIAT